MIRPIDTQIIHPQTPIVAGREQRNNHLPTEQQSQFGDIMKKEVDHKKDSVISSQSAENLKTDEDGSKESAAQYNKHSKKRQKQSQSKKNQFKNDSSTGIDIKI